MHRAKAAVAGAAGQVFKSGPAALQRLYGLETMASTCPARLEIRTERGRGRDCCDLPAGREPAGQEPFSNHAGRIIVLESCWKSTTAADARA
ncbi:hypothetical protein, partial [Nitrobacter winogradskyi]|uniref:hypothetical protein n=1 Tax=Nitrobacter winogradskyi TaxID=913 RepID=UPI001AEE817C